MSLRASEKAKLVRPLTLWRRSRSGVMEHMRDPYLATREIARITKLCGLTYVESAFMQPLHAVPYYFFNTTVFESLTTPVTVTN